VLVNPEMMAAIERLHTKRHEMESDWNEFVRIAQPLFTDMTKIVDMLLIKEGMEGICLIYHEIRDAHRSQNN